MPYDSSVFLNYNYSDATSNGNFVIGTFDNYNGQNPTYKGNYAMTENTDGSLTFWFFHSDFRDTRFYYESWLFTWFCNNGIDKSTTGYGQNCLAFHNNGRPPTNYTIETSSIVQSQTHIVLGVFGIVSPQNDTVSIFDPEFGANYNVFRARLWPQSKPGTVIRLANASHFFNGDSSIGNQSFNDGNTWCPDLTLKGKAVSITPALTNVNPPWSDRGTIVTILGAHITGDYTPYFGSLSYPAPKGAVTISTMTCTVPTAIPLGATHVFLSNGTYTTNAVPFTVTLTRLRSAYSNEASCIIPKPVHVPPPPRLVAISVTPAAVTITEGQSTQFHCVGTYDDGSAKTVSGLWSVTDVSGIGTIDPQTGLFVAITAGSNVIVRAQVTNAVGAVLSGTANVVIAQRVHSPSPLVSVTVTPASATVIVGKQLQYTAVGTNADGLTVFPPINWSCTPGPLASISSKGLLTAAATGGYTVLAAAQDGSGITGSTIGTVLPIPYVPPPPHLANFAISPKSAVVAAGQTIQFNATSLDQYGNPFPENVVYSIANISGGGSVDPTSGLFLAQIAGTNVQVTATTLDGSATTDTAHIIVIPGPIQRLAVNPPNVLLQNGQGQQFTAMGYDSYGNALVLTPTWSMIGGVGTVNSSGLFSSTTTGVGKVLATYNAISGTATINVLTLVGGVVIATTPQVPFARVHVRDAIAQPLVIDTRVRGGGLRTGFEVDLSDDFWWDLRSFDGLPVQMYGVFAVNVAAIAGAGQIVDYSKSKDFVNTILGKFSAPHFLGVITPQTAIPESIV